jgi:hypothetical protein
MPSVSHSRPTPRWYSLAGLFEIGTVGESLLIGGLDLLSPFVDLSSL